MLVNCKLIMIILFSEICTPINLQIPTKWMSLYEIGN